MYREAGDKYTTRNPKPRGSRVEYLTFDRWESLQPLRAKNYQPAMTANSVYSRIGKWSIDFIVDTVGKNILFEIRGCGLTKAAWNTLPSRYSKEKMTNKLGLSQSFFSYTHESGVLDKSLVLLVSSVNNAQNNGYNTAVSTEADSIEVLFWLTSRTTIQKQL